MKKIIYIANVRLPTEKAHGIQIMKTCEAFACIGVAVELIVPFRTNYIKNNPFDYYKVENIFSIKKLFSIDLVFLGKIGFWIQSLSFSLSIFIFSLLNILKGEKVVYYSRDELPLLSLILIGQKTVWESHMGQINYLTNFIISHDSLNVAITKGLKDLYSSKSKEEILVAPDGVDLKQFKIYGEKAEIRSKFGLPNDKKIVLYTGHLYEWKGASILAAAASKLDKDTIVVFVGGTEKDILNFEEKYSKFENIKILGQKPHHEIPYYLKASDILVIPNSAKEDISKFYTSPMKLFEYMASGTPIVASDLPSIREILNESNACFFKSDDPESLAISIRDLLNNKEKQVNISTKSSHDIVNYSWDSRAKNIINFIYHV